MQAKEKLIKVGRKGVVTGRGAHIPAFFFRHQQPGKCFVILEEGERRLMHVRAKDLDTIRRAYREYVAARKDRGRGALPAQP